MRRRSRPAVFPEDAGAPLARSPFYGGMATPNTTDPLSDLHREPADADDFGTNVGEELQQQGGYSAVSSSQAEIFQPGQSRCRKRPVGCLVAG
jgi:hypothetical protein